MVQRDDPLTASLPGDQTTTDWQRQVAQERSRLRTAIQADILTGETAANVDIALHLDAVQGEQAVARVILPGERGTPAYRQTRFYQRTTNGWVQTAPDAALWGPERRLETPSFVYHFRENDARAVIAAESQVETLYTTLRRNAGLPIVPTPEKLSLKCG